MQAHISWVDSACRFLAKPSVSQVVGGGTTFATFWASGEIFDEWKNDDGCECVRLRIRFGGVFKFIFKWTLPETTKDYIIVADGSGQAQPV